MNPDQLTSRQRKRYIIAAAVVVGILIVLVTFPLFLNGQSDDTEPGQGQDTIPIQTEQPDATATTVAISNFNDVIRGLPTGRRAFIEEILSITVELNLPENDDATEITDATIREGSYNQTFNDQTQILSTEFIVDIPSIKQSYRITDMFSARPPEVTGLFDHTTNVFCLDASQLIYPPFGCRDNRSAGEAT